jgi:cytochrome c-type biogenesis protein CcmE
MNRVHKQRLIYISVLMIGLAVATGLILFALRQNINVFFTPSDLLNLSQSKSVDDHFIRLGGMVKTGSVMRDSTGLGVQFIVTDLKNEIKVYYQGILPDLFREGKGMVAEGRLNNERIFIANHVLAKHDENYMPPKRIS